jgi:hypothetical protein
MLTEDDKMDEQNEKQDDETSFDTKEESLETLVGQPEATAVELLKNNGWKVRITVRDGEPFIGTCDFRDDRVQLQVRDGKITKISIG